MAGLPEASPESVGMSSERLGWMRALLEDHVTLFAAVSRLADAASEAASADWRARFYELRRSLALHESREEGVVNSELRRSG